jgi:hypothetical protein
MHEKGELIASVFRHSNGQVTLAWCPAGRVEPQDWPTVSAARRSVDEAWSDLDWEEVMPGEWLAWEAS